MGKVKDTPFSSGVQYECLDCCTRFGDQYDLPHLWLIAVQGGYCGNPGKFSNNPCAICGTLVAGDRFIAHRGAAYAAEHLEICRNCVDCLNSEVNDD